MSHSINTIMLWLFSFFQEFFAHLIFGTGALLLLASFFLALVPGAYQYKTLATVVGIIMLVYGAFLEGKLDQQRVYDKRVAELKLEQSNAKVKTAEANTQLVEKIVTKTQIIKEKGDTVIEYIKENSEDIDDHCILTPSVIDAHNKAATLNFNETTIALPPRTDGEPK